ncbi:MAG: hypothetical protein ACO33F_07035 [Ilumatobacteraceae bacterium]|jgi:hypothetical protein
MANRVEHSAGDAGVVDVGVVDTSACDAIIVLELRCDSMLALG